MRTLSFVYKPPSTLTRHTIQAPISITNHHYFSGTDIDTDITHTHTRLLKMKPASAVAAVLFAAAKLAIPAESNDTGQAYCRA